MITQHILKENLKMSTINAHVECVEARSHSFSLKYCTTLANVQSTENIVEVITVDGNSCSKFIT